jgi:hypothetical protein
LTGFREFNDLVNQLPEEDKPSMFGLPANIQQAYQRTRSSETLQVPILLFSFGLKFTNKTLCIMVIY